MSCEEFPFVSSRFWRVTKELSKVIILQGWKVAKAPHSHLEMSYWFLWLLMGEHLESLVCSASDILFTRVFISFGLLFYESLGPCCCCFFSGDCPRQLLEWCHNQIIQGWLLCALCVFTFRLSIFVPSLWCKFSRKKARKTCPSCVQLGRMIVDVISMFSSQWHWKAFPELAVRGLSSTQFVKGKAKMFDCQSNNSWNSIGALGDPKKLCPWIRNEAKRIPLKI